jgi:hypothetical protein
MQNYDFPVELQAVVAANGSKVPGYQAVVRTDTQMPLSVVSSKYKLVSHSNVMDAAQDFIMSFGTPEVSYSLSQNGAILVAECTYRERTVEVGVGDCVGLRVFIENSYNATKSVRVLIGGLVLSCLNGMVCSKSIFDYRYRHTGSQKIVFPSDRDVLHAWRNEACKWQAYHTIDIGQSDYARLTAEAIGAGLLPQVSAGHMNTSQSCTLWDFVQNCTNYLTHRCPRLSGIGRVNRLERLSRWLNDKALKMMGD